MHTVDKWYKHEPKTVEEKNDITILYEMPIHTDREISANHPDNRDKKCTLNVVVKSSDKNAFTNVSEKLSKYKDLEKEITRMWQMETGISAVVVGALRVIKKGSEKLVREILGNLNLWERYIFYRRSYSSSDNEDKATLKYPRFKVSTQPLEKKYDLMNLTQTIMIIIA